MVRIDVVCPVLPKYVELRIGDENTGKVDHQGSKNEGVDQRCKVLVGGVDSDGLSDGRVEKLEDDQGEVNLTGDAGLDWESDDEVEANKVKCSADNQGRNLCNNLSRHEGDPAIGLTLLLSGLKNIAVGNKQRLELVDDTHTDKKNVEDGEKAHLEIVRRGADPPEGKTRKQGRHDVQDDLVPDVIGLSPQCNKVAISDDFKLAFQGAGKLKSIRYGAGRGGETFIFDNTLLIDCQCVLEGCNPPVVPVDTGENATLDNVDNMLGRVDIVRAGGTASGKVIKNLLGGLAGVAKVSGLSTTLKKQKSVKVVKERGRRLMNRADWIVLARFGRI